MMYEDIKTLHGTNELISKEVDGSRTKKERMVVKWKMHM